jgi:hypothetical protein
VGRTALGADRIDELGSVRADHQPVGAAFLVGLQLSGLGLNLLPGL